ncbi:hypothetical protein CRE_28348 [Caenorhabditis remanei]|uniref:Uncharacterized protein n=2 Tax=Caenorhabditis remanei TaxID=31234 RepID=E3LNE0_CAERE|nr:hypothetical protein CRE_28348 [Caenorhabditis remanei]
MLRDGFHIVETRDNNIILMRGLQTVYNQNGSEFTLINGMTRVDAHGEEDEEDDDEEEESDEDE